MVITQSSRWPTSTIVLWYAHCCSAKLFFFSAGHFRPFQAHFGCAELFSSILNGFSPLPSSFQLCWALFCSAKHFSSMPCCTQHSRNTHGRAEKPLSIEERRLEEPKRAQHSRKMLGRAEKNAQHSWKMLGRAGTLLSIEEKWLAEQKNTRYSREMLGRAEQCSAEKKCSSAEQQCAYWRSFVLVGHSTTHLITPDFLWLSGRVDKITSRVYLLLLTSVTSGFSDKLLTQK